MPSNLERTTTTKAAILDAATALLREEGARGLTLGGVAKRAGISKGALTHHFASKEALLGEVLDLHFRAFADVLEASDLPYPVAYVRHGAHDGTHGLAHGLITALALHPEVLGVAREHARAWQERMPSTDATVARLATDGLWLADVLGLPLPDDRTAVLSRLEELAGGNG